MKQCPRNNPNIVSEKLSSIESLIRQKEFNQALAELRDLENQRGFGKFIEESGEFYYLFALALQGLGNYKEALSKAKQSFEILRNSSETEKLAKVQFISGIIYSDLGDMERAEVELRDALGIYRRIKNEEGIIESYNELARIHFIKTEYDKAIEYLQKGLSYCKQTKDDKRIARFCGNLGRIYLLIGKWKEAKKNLLLSLESNKLNNNSINICCCYLSLGYLSYLMRDFSQSNKYLEKALKLIFENSYTREFAIYSEYSGELEFAQGNYEKAKNHYMDCISRMEEIAPESDMISQTYRLLAELQVAEKQYDEALSSCEKALKVAESLGEKIEIGAIHRALGQIYTAKKEKAKAKENFEKGISILGEIQAKYELAKTYLEAGKSNAFEYLERIIHLSKAKELFRELETGYYVGTVDLTFAEFFFDSEEYDKAEAFLEEAEKIFKESDEAKELEWVLELKAKLSKAQGWIEEKLDSKSKYFFSSLTTQDSQMLAVIERARKYKDLDFPILLEGETGTGKDLLAKVIHCESKRKDNRFVKVNCAAIPETLLESELFGYRKGAFTGADRDKKGLFEQADGGTIFLNEIGDLPIRLQAKILDVVEDKEVTRLGELEPRKVDFRVIVASNKNLDEEVTKGNFRKDLHYRLNVVKFTLPPLRERKKDIPLLIDHFLKKHSIKGMTKEITFESDLMSVFVNYDWPGNIRELQNEIMKLIVESNGNKFSSLLLSNRFHMNCDKDGTSSDKEEGISFDGRVTEYEKKLILKALEENNWIKAKAAKALKMPAMTLNNKIKKYHIEIPI